MKRKVYDNLGVSALISCPKCLNFKEYLDGSFREVIGFYSGTSIAITSMGMITGNLYAPYWKLLMFATLVSIDILLKTCVNDPFPFILHWRTPAEKIILARELFIVLSIAMSHIGPLLFPVDSRSLKDLIHELEGLTHRELDSSISRIIRVYGPYAEKGSGKLISL